jgi:hypothetical protein
MTKYNAAGVHNCLSVVGNGAIVYKLILEKN